MVRNVAISEEKRNSTEGISSSLHCLTILPKLCPERSMASNSNPLVGDWGDFGARASIDSALIANHFRYCRARSLSELHSSSSSVPNSSETTSGKHGKGSEGGKGVTTLQARCSGSTTCQAVSDQNPSEIWFMKEIAGG